jgi:hypothetical protein
MVFNNCMVACSVLYMSALVDGRHDMSIHLLDYWQAQQSLPSPNNDCTTYTNMFVRYCYLRRYVKHPDPVTASRMTMVRRRYDPDFRLHSCK